MDWLIVNCFSDIHIFQLAYSTLYKEELYYIPEEYMLQMFLYPYRTSIFAYTIVLKLLVYQTWRIWANNPKSKKEIIYNSLFDAIG